MRWKLIAITSLLGALIAGGAWCLLTIAGFNRLGVFFSHPGIVLISMVIPIFLSLFAAIFVYRHTAQRRKTQALITMVLTLLLAFGIYLAVMRFFQRRISLVTLHALSTGC